MVMGVMHYFGTGQMCVRYHKKDLEVWEALWLERIVWCCRHTALHSDDGDVRGIGRMARGLYNQETAYNELN